MKIWLSQTETDSQAKSVWWVLEVFSFLEWSLDTLSRTLRKAASSNSSPKLEEALEFLSILDSAVGDRQGEVSCLFA